MPYVISNLLVPKSILTDLGIMSGMPDDNGRVVDRRFKTRSTNSTGIAHDVYEFINKKLVRGNVVQLADLSESVDDISFEVDLMIGQLANLIKSVQLQIVATIDHVHEDTIEKALNAINNRSTLISVAHVRNASYGAIVREDIDMLGGYVDQLFRMEDTSQHAHAVACMEIVLDRIYKYL